MARHSPNDTRYSFAAVVAGLIVGAGAAAALFYFGSPLPLVAGAGLVIGLFVAASIKYTDQWEKAVLLRLGRYRGLRGPGYFAVVPIIDRVSYHIDQRIRTAAFGAESCLTRDTVPVNVDAIAFWIVRDAERAALEVQDYDEAVILSAQTALRDAIGKHDLAELIQSRTELGHGLKVALEQKMQTWGIQVQSVEIRDVIIPPALEDAMSRQAQAERERQARIILGTAETEIAHKFVEAADSYRNHPAAMNLRAMNMLYESIVKRGSLMVVPSGLADSLNLPRVLGMMGAVGHVPQSGGVADETPATGEADLTAPGSAGLAAPRATAAPRWQQQRTEPAGDVALVPVGGAGGVSGPV
ncbi:MAG TPA: slipin family protein [Gemmatimonadaceae bacterium]|nr:slipin family protein [Gemmatimonadaceae bacterium]